MAIIKAGTYVFVEEPTITEAYNQSLNYKVHYLTAENVYATNTFNAILLSTTATWGGTITCSRAENITEYPVTRYVGNSKRWQSSPDDSSNFFATDTTKLRTIIVETDQTVADDFYTWFTANTALQPKLSIDLTTLPGWANLSTGNHTIKIKAKGTGYTDSELSAGVVVSKAASIPALADATWEQINQVSQAGTASNYWAVGDEKTITLSTGEAVTVQILGFNHDDLADGSGKAGISFGMKNLLTTTYPMNNSETNYGGWTSSVMRTSTMATLLTELPDDLQSVVKQIYKKTTLGRANTTIVKSTDSLFLFSEVELDGTTSDGYSGEGSQYEYWQNHNVQSNRIKKFPKGVAGYWWLRSPAVDDNRTFRNVSRTGIIEYASPTLSYGVCFGFCV